MDKDDEPEFITVEYIKAKMADDMGDYLSMLAVQHPHEAANCDCFLCRWLKAYEELVDGD